MLAKINSIRGAFSDAVGAPVARPARFAGDRAQAEREFGAPPWWRSAGFFLALALLFSGCTPAGPSALLKGKKYLDRGDAAAAVTEFKRATTLLATNANAWNYLGVALQRAGQPDDAMAAYQNAIKLDRDLVETHFNLGCLALEQNHADVAKAEFTAYTLRRPNDAAGWLKLGFAQLKANDVIAAERSFSSVLALKPNDAEAYNALGLASIQLRKSRDAAQFFGAALQSRADFAPALLNLATVNQQYLHDNKAALENYRSYLALSPRPANYDDVKAIVAGLEQSDVATTVMTPAVVKTSAPPTEPKPKTASAATQHPPPASRSEQTETATHVPPRTTSVTPAPTQPVTTIPEQTVQVQPETPIVVAPKTNPPASRPPATTAVVSAPPHATNPPVAPESIEVPMPDDQPRRGFFHRLFGTYRTNSVAKPNARGENLTPISAPTDTMADTKPAEEKPAATKPAPAPSFPRYAYTAPAKPAAGDRHAAEGAFTKARLAEQDENWPDALQWYQSAADLDASWFEAQYNAGVIAHRLNNYTVALPRYEFALAIQPDSVDARYNFSLALKAAGYAPDAADELKKILAVNPEEVRAHLALANLCAQSLHDTAQARQHYQKVLELQPDNPQAGDIRFWLSANAK
jgi:tetratricopeptide (TPR) repeat protein